MARHLPAPARAGHDPGPRGRGRSRDHAGPGDVGIIAGDLCGQTGSVPDPTATLEDLAETVKEVEAAGRRIAPTQADVRDHDALKAAADGGVAKPGRLGIVPGATLVRRFKR